MRKIGVERDTRAWAAPVAVAPRRGRDDDGMIAVGHALVHEAAVGGKRRANAFDDTEEHVAAIERFVQTFVDHREQLTVTRLPARANASARSVSSMRVATLQNAASSERSSSSGSPIE